MGWRLSVAIGVVFFCALALAFARAGRARDDATRRPRPRIPAESWLALLLASIGLGLESIGDAPWVEATLDWLPGVYLLAGYWLPARLPLQPAPRLQARLERGDQLLCESGVARLVARAPRLCLEYLEAAYLSCYLVVPAGLAILYLAGHRVEADRFWTAVLLAALPCYGLVARFATRPPRSAERPAPATTCGRPLTMRRVNLAVLDRASIGLNTFPSGHASAAFAAALSVGAVMPATGALLGLLAISIAVGSVAGRYHYALDAAFGALAGIAAFALSRLV